MKRLRWQLLIVFLALVAIGLLLLSQQPGEIPSIEPEPVSGGVYSEALIGSFSRLNPILDYRNSADRDVDRLLFNGLVRFDDRGLPQPELAESWGIARDATIYNFSMRQDAVWHDGEPVTSADVLFTIELLRDPNLPIPDDLNNLWQDVEVEALNQYTLQFRLPEPFAPFLDYLTFGLLPEHLLGGLSPEELIAAPFNLEPIGNGPYRFDHLLVEDERVTGVVLAAFEDYYAQTPFIEEFVFRYYPDDQAAMAAYQQGEVLGISRITQTTLRAALTEPNLNLYTSRLPELTLILLNLDNPETPFFQELDVRQSLLMGINRQSLIDRALNSQAAIADSPIFPNTWAYYNGIERVPYAPEKAIELLRKVDYTIPAEGGSVRAREDVRLSFTLLHPEGQAYTTMAEIIQANWVALGIQVTLEALPYEQLVRDHLNTRLYEAALVELNLARSPDPDPYPFWHQTQATGGQNYSLWNDRQASEYLEQARIIVDPLERTRLYRNFQVRFSDELPALPLYYPMYSYAVDNQVQGVRIGPLFEPSDRFNHVTDWFLFSEQGVEEIEVAAPTQTPSGQ